MFTLKKAKIGQHLNFTTFQLLVPKEIQPKKGFFNDLRVNVQEMLQN